MSDFVDEAVAATELERETLIARSAEAVAQPGAIHCEDCATEIPEERRAVAPFATRCIHCQTRLERGA